MVGTTMVDVKLTVVVEYCVTETTPPANVRPNNTEAIVTNNHRSWCVLLIIITQHSKSGISLASIGLIIPYGVYA
jgi:hypothetical protein